MEEQIKELYNDIEFPCMVNSYEFQEDNWLEEYYNYCLPFKKNLQ